ncbi:Phenylacetic acid catabolic protein [Siminovitchia terrae]|uniref:Phenylacetic acid catabolic protein n=1 Tax=Siminovitchia terrae TaxID=1914933 RepID=UPI001B1744FF|nr:Phenylacetic acid catabolic protein [Siminovitchia terrae]GIN89093.1 phenylacetate-CoA oxygenase subunit PaaI [Siminovitchia terrae]
MAEDVRNSGSFIELLETIADNKFVLGDRLVEIGVSGPNLEATLAAVAMAQGELGHARLLYNWIFELKGLKPKKPNIERQTGKAFKGVVETHNWITLMTSLYTVVTAVDIVLSSISEKGNDKTISRIQKLMKEQKEHIVYAQQWARQLLNDQGAIPVAFKESLNNMLPEVKQWLKEVAETTGITDSGYVVNDTSLISKFQEELNKLNLDDRAVVY